VTTVETSTASEVAAAASTDALLVTVVVPVHNGEEFLRESLDSILAQTHSRLEVIVMDDASTDETPRILASYGDAIRVVRQPETRGIYGNANDGIELAAGELIGVFHADDIYLPTLVEREVDYLERHPDVGAVFASDVFVDGQARELGRLSLPPELSGDRPLDYATVLDALLRYKNSFLRCPTALVRTAVYRELGGYRDDRFKNTSDLEMWLRIARSYRLAVLEEHLLRYRRGHGSSSERYHAVRTDPERFFEILDLELASGGRSLATSRALAAYEGHRAHDAIRCAVNAYIAGDLATAAGRVRTIRLAQLAPNDRVPRLRLAATLLALRVLTRLPHLRAAAWALRRARGR
jgi:glycosyltransferase involved in cell wall biosynthesis